MALSRHSVLCVVFGLSLVSSACGGSDDSSGDDNNGNANTGGDDASDGGSNGQTNAGANDGNNNGTTGGGSNQTTGGTTGGVAGDACTGPGQQCTCSNGQMGAQACTDGVLGECTCSLDLSDAGLPPVAACPATATCRSTMNLITGVPGFCSPAPTDGGMTTPGAGFLPPSCMTKADCETAGLPETPCSTIMIGMPRQMCLQPCNP